MTRKKIAVAVLYNHVGKDEYEDLRKIDPATLDFQPEYPIHVATVREEYQAIVDAGFLLQLDCPDFTGLGAQIENGGLGEFRRNLQRRVDVLNDALEGLPPEQLRMHLCWGNWAGPHTHDVPLRDIIDVVFKARPSAISFEGANPRHEHEWAVFKDVKLPEGKAIRSWSPNASCATPSSSGGSAYSRAATAASARSSVVSRSIRASSG